MVVDTDETYRTEQLEQIEGLRKQSRGHCWASRTSLTPKPGIVRLSPPSHHRRPAPRGRLQLSGVEDQLDTIDGVLSRGRPGEIDGSRIMCASLSFDSAGEFTSARTRDAYLAEWQKTWASDRFSGSCPHRAKATLEGVEEHNATTRSCLAGESGYRFRPAGGCGWRPPSFYTGQIQENFQHHHSGWALIADFHRASLLALRRPRRCDQATPATSAEA